MSPTSSDADGNPWRSGAGDPRLAQLPIPDRSIHLMLRRLRPGDGSTALVLAHAGHTHAEPWIEGVEIAYLVEDGSRTTPLDDVGWADWDAEGRLLVATRGGEIQIREPSGSTWSTTWSHDLNGLEPDPMEAPPWARAW